MEVLKNQREFFRTQQTKQIAFRKRSLKRLQKEIESKEDAICDALYADFKKPRFETLVAESQFVLSELKLAIKNLELWARPERKSSSLANWPSSDHIYKEPYGSVLIIAPWNYPFQLVFTPLIGALAAGNTVVVKPSEATPNTSKIIQEIITGVFPKEYVAVIEGGVAVSQQLLTQDWDYIFFTGSTRVGKIVYESAAKHMTPVTLELGGKNPCIVDQTAVIDLSAKRIVWGKFLNAGQTCIAPDYILVHRKVKDKLITSIKRHIINCFGPAIETSPNYARLVNEKHYQGLKEMLVGENIIFGGETNDRDNFMAPTLIDTPKMEGKVMKGEIFGPILPIITYETIEEIANLISRYDKPLATYVFSTDRKFQDKIISDFSFGGGAINDTIIQITNKNLPFGGVGPSGIGAYHGKETFELFSHHKAIIKKANWIDPPFRYPPYTLPIRLIKKIKHLF
ncbi:aldehyde dehydrogenase [Maribacter polysaccharolyticus]|uniref:aldehyde dehydrogenase n=1 Tax=Maribacter polysaccharolyticus TaxID=3020831 RepID=UPI00237F9369|nr:aldehyde dehydrogenase [Maribacter polysaccharolyticus]MDE3740272.1 aldehyde dehydrogenase [Maribacter polysaccharolyticus]